MTSGSEPLFERIMALGDSVIQGTQNVGVSVRSQPFGLPALLARHVGAPLPLPLLAEPGYPPHIDDPSAVIRARVTHPEYLQGRRLDPHLEPANLGIAGARLTDVVHLTCGNMAGLGRTRAVQRMMRLVLNPTECAEMEWLSQVDRVVAARPTLVLLWAGTNDVVESLFYPTMAVTPPPVFARLWRRLIDRLLRETDAAIACVTLPDVTLMPMLHVWRRHRRLMERMRATLGAYNRVIMESESASPRLAVLNLGPVIPSMVTEGVSTAEWELPFEVEQGKLTMQPLRGSRGRVSSGGLISYDGLHPTNTGYAVLTNHLLAALERRFDLDLGRLDVAAVARQDLLLGRANGWSWRLLTSYLTLTYGRGVADLERQPWPLTSQGSTLSGAALEGESWSQSVGATATRF